VNIAPLSVTVAILASTSLMPGAMPAAHAAKAPHPLVTDNRVKQVAYDPNQVYEIVGTYGYQTSIEFADDEQVKVVTLGDSIAWQTVPYQNRLFIKPVEPNAATNLTVITSKRTYYFKLNTTKSRPAMTFLVRFMYPNPSASQRAGNGIAANRTGVKVNPATLNLDYGVSGNKAAIGLTRVFDDGQFTYFMFDKNAEIPSFYLVGADGTEAIVNSRREGQYMVVERTGSRFTLRNGGAYLCVQNQLTPLHSTAAQAERAKPRGIE
jgi:type IV secretion system protein VirB9